MANKICCRCNITKDETEFYFRNKDNNIRRGYCKTCASNTMEIYHSNPTVKEKRKEYYKQWYHSNKKIKIKIKTKYIDKRPILDTKICTNCSVTKNINEFYYDKNRGNYYSSCKECVGESTKNRRDIIYARRKEYMQKHLEIRIKTNLQTRLWDLLISRSSTSETLNKYIGCSYSFLLNWIQYQFYDGMTMKNYGKSWHIDHCKPCSAFDLTNEDQMKNCFNWKNLRPLKKEKNLIKNNKIDTHAILMQELISTIYKKTYL